MSVLADIRARRLARQAEEHEKAGRPLRAARDYDAALVLKPGVTAWMERRASCYEQARRWRRAIRAYGEVAEHDDRAVWYYRMGNARLRMGDAERARAAFAKALARDRKSKPVDRRLLAASPYELQPRQRMVRFIRPRLDSIRAVAAPRVEPGRPPPRRLFVYWAQGWDAAPPLVRMCREQVIQLHDPNEVVLLDEATLPDWIDPPSALKERLASAAHLADIIRLDLLSRHGGVWLDATCYPTANVLDAIAEPSATGLFAFTRRTARLSNWLIAASAGNYVVEMLRVGLNDYWAHYDEPFHYNVFHQMFEAFYLLDETFRATWDAVPVVSTDPPHLFQRAMRGPYDAARFDELLQGCFVHKLTYKYRPEFAADDTMLRALLERHA